MHQTRFLKLYQRLLEDRPAGERHCRHRCINQLQDYRDLRLRSRSSSGRENTFRSSHRHRADAVDDSVSSPHKSACTPERSHRSNQTKKRGSAFDSVAYWSEEASPPPPSTQPAILQHKMYGGYKSPKSEEEQREQEEKDNKERERRAKLFARTPKEMERKSRTYRRLARWNPDTKGAHKDDTEDSVKKVTKWRPRAVSIDDRESQISPTFVPLDERGPWETVTYKKKKQSRGKVTL